MKKMTALVLGATAVLSCVSPAMADEQSAAAGNDALIVPASSLQLDSANDRMRVEVAPNYSEELGWSIKGAAGAYLTDEMALGLIVEYGENKSEYLANAGIQFNDSLSLVGSIGLLDEHIEFVDGQGRDGVQQMEYGASLKGAYEQGIFQGFELNGYLSDANSDSRNAETGKLYGVQLMADLGLAATTHVKIGGGYEWLAWDDGQNNDSFAFSAEGTQQIGDILSVSASAKLGASEFVYAGGLDLDLSNGGANTNKLGLNYSYIDGQNGVQDDQRVELGWTIGFGAGPVVSVAAADAPRDSSNIRPTADVAVLSPANNLLGSVMKRPAYMPEQVIARAKHSGGGQCVATPWAPRDAFALGSSLALGVNYISDTVTVEELQTATITVNGHPELSMTYRETSANMVFYDVSGGTVTGGETGVATLANGDCYSFTLTAP